MILHRDPREPDDSARPQGRREEGPDRRPKASPSVEWTPFDPGDAPELPSSVDGAGRVVAMIASTELVGVGWATAVASELARVWAGKRPGIVLVDTDLERPRLHHAARVSNATGLAEVLRGETPVGDAAQVVEEDRLFCVPAGNALDDPAAGFDPARWRRLCKAFSDAGVTVVAYVPVQAPWLDAVLDTATDVVLLTEQYRRLQWPNRDDAPPLRAVLGPMLLKDPPPNPTGRPGSRSAPLLGFDLPPGAKELDELEIIELEPEDEATDPVDAPDLPATPFAAGTATGAEDLADAEVMEFADEEVIELADEEEPLQENGTVAEPHGSKPHGSEPVMETPPPETGAADAAHAEIADGERVNGERWDPAADVASGGEATMASPGAGQPDAPSADAGAWASTAPDPVPDDGVAEGPGTVTVGTLAPRVRARRDAADARIRQGRRRMAVGALLVAAAVVAWAVSRSGGEAEVADGGEPAPAETGPVTPAQARPAPSTVRPVSPAAEFSVGVASYTDGARAEDEATRLATAFPGLSWMVAPAEIDGTVYHRVVGGLLPDSAAALGLGAELARGGVTDWLVRRSGWVVELGTWATSEEAERQRAAAAADGIPAYLSRIQLTDGTHRYAVYAGAYGGEEEAGYLVDRARSAGFEAHVVPRMGRPPS